MRNIENLIRTYEEWLMNEEKSAATIEKYTKAVSDFLRGLGGRDISRQAVIDWKKTLLDDKLTPATVNTRIAAVNSFLRFADRQDCRVRPLRIQRRIFRSEERNLSKSDYLSLISAAERTGEIQLALVIETIGSTGIRVIELKYITVEAADRGQAVINMKGKIRSILIPARLRRKLKKYAERNKIASGEIFLSRGGKSMSRKYIWAKMKKLCSAAGIEPAKVFPHNLRHLFAVSYYRICRDVAKLADVLGHSSIETTRIYLISTGAEHMNVLNEMKMVV